MAESPFDLSGRSAVVTGASPGGLGHAAARALLRAGARVLLTDLPAHEEELADAAQALTAYGDTSWAVADLTREDDVDALVASALGAWGAVDVLVHTAGAMQRRASLETERADFDRVVEINLHATWLVDRAFAAPMIERGGGSIVNTSSVYAAMVGRLPEPAYYASKAAVANLTRGLAAEWGPSGVRVNCLAPGVFYPTRMTAPLADDPGRLETMTERTMLGRLGDPDTDLDGPVVWLASDASRYVTAQTVYVDGGWGAW